MKRKTKQAFETLLKTTGGEGNQKFQKILVPAITSLIVREALQKAIELKAFSPR